MILVDTSVWVEHLRGRRTDLAQLLLDARVLAHPFIIGELACGNLKNRREVLSLIAALPAATVADHCEVLRMIESKQLMGCGIGWTDCHLIASALLSGAPLWTLDRRLRSASIAANVAY